MMNLKDLVPPLELCKRIPEGELENSALVWAYGKEISENGILITRRFIEPGEYVPWSNITTAPTLEELIVALSDISISSTKVCKSFNEWHVECCIPIEYGERFVSEDSSKNAATAALKLLLKLKGIEA